MNTPSNHQENFEVFPSPIFDPFPEPRAYPSGWDLSGFVPASSLPAAEPAEDEAEA
jgi:hypothetical protein